MADTPVLAETNGATPAPDAAPVFQIQRVYLKESSLEQPNSPGILLVQEQPTVDIQLGVNAEPVADGIFEVSVTATVQTKIKDKTVFLVEAKQLLKTRGVAEIEEIRIDEHHDERAKMMEITGRRTVPQIFIGSTHVGGCDDLMALDSKSELMPMLNAA